MFNILSLSNFRVFNDFSVNIKPITLISGKNNSGKTTILESIFLLNDYANPGVFLKLLGFRGIRSISTKTLWEPLFYEMNTNKGLKIKTNELSLNIKRNDRYVLANNIPNELNSINYALICEVKKGNKLFKGDYIIGSDITLINRNENNQPITTPFVQYLGPNVVPDDISVANWFGILDLSGKKEKLIKFLKILDDNIVDVATIMLDNVVQLYVTNRQNIKMPISVMGDGIRKIMNIALTMLANPSCILLCDEIENGLHYSLHQKFWELIISLVKDEDCQIIATTHSYECINGVLEGIKEKNANEIFAYIRLENEDGIISPKMFTNEMLDFALSSELEVR